MEGISFKHLEKDLKAAAILVFVVMTPVINWILDIQFIGRVCDSNSFTLLKLRSVAV